MAAERKETTSFVAHYLETRGPEMAEIHDAWALESTLNESKSKYEAKGKHEEFMEALQEYGRLEGRRLPFNPVDCSWTDVLKELEKAEDVAVASEKGDRKFFINSRRKLSIISQSIVPLLDAIPDELCILHGGLAIIFHLAQHREKVRRDILDTFEDIPGIIAMACSKSRSFPEDIKLHDSIDELKLTLFDAIPSLIEILMPGKFLAKVTSLFRGFQVQDILNCIQRKARGVEAFARNLQDELIVKSYLVNKEVQNMSATTQVQLKEIHGGVSSLDKVVCGLDDRCQEIDTHIVELKDFISKQIHDALASKNGMFQMLKDVVSGFLCNEQEPGLNTNRTWTTSRRNSSPEHLINLLQVPVEQEIQDLDFVLRQSKEFDTISKSYGALVIASSRFQRWVASSETNLIYVEGHIDSSRFGKTSPVSYFCANLVRVFKDSATNITLHSFCGQHVASNDDLQGPRGLIRCLLTQLLQVWSSEPIHGVELSDLNGYHESIPIDDLCQIFKLLLRQVPIQSTVFCIIDDFSQFEKDRWDEDYWHFLRMLGSLIIGEEIDIRFKVLITSSTKSKRLQEHIPEEMRIQVTERDRSMGFRAQPSWWEKATG